MSQAAANRQRLAAILAADAAGYSRLMNADEHGTLAALDAARDVFKSEMESSHGRVIDTAGDSVLAVFETAAGAVNAALAIQVQLENLAAGVPADRRLRFRIGVHLGDVIEKADGTVYGDGVNIAARLQGLALPGGVTVSDAVQGAVRNRIAATFEDLGEQAVRNIADPVRAFRVVAASGEPAKSIALLSMAAAIKRALRRRWWLAGGAALLLVGAASLFLADRGSRRNEGPPLRSVAILPFKAPAGASDEAYAEAFTRDFTAALGRTLPGSPVASSSSVDAYRDKPVDARAIGRDLNVRYLIEGEVRRTADQVVVNLALLDAQSSRQVWGERIKTPADKLAEWPDLPLVRVVFAARSGLSSAEWRRIAAQPVRRADAMELVFRAYWVDDSTAEKMKQAMDLCEAALRSDPDSAPALVCKATLLFEQLDLGASSERAQLVAEADTLTRRAVELAPENAAAWEARGEALRFQFQWDAALEANTRANRLDPSFGLANTALYMIFVGRPEAALPLLARTEEISPRFLGYSERVACRAYISLGRFDDAVRSCERAIVADESSFGWLIHLNLAVAYAQKGDLSKALVERDKTIARKPDASIAWYRDLMRQITDKRLYWEQHDMYMEPGLRKAGFPER